MIGWGKLDRWRFWWSWRNVVMLISGGIDYWWVESSGLGVSSVRWGVSGVRWGGEWEVYGKLNKLVW